MHETTERRAERAQAEGALLEPSLPHGGALPPALFANRPFTWFVASIGVSQLGFWGFLVIVLGQAGYRFHAQAFQLGILFASFSVAFLLLTTPFGMVVDRWSPKWFLVVGQLISIGAVVVALLGHSLWWLYAASAIDGVGAAASIPARGSLTALMVDQDSLVKANGMQNTASMLAVIVGPGLSGFIVRSSGPDAVYWFIFATLVVGALLLLPIPDRRPRGAEGGSFLTDLIDGFKVSVDEPELRSLVFLAGSAWFLLTTLVALEPLFVKEVLHRGISVLAYLWSANGIGAFAGALALTQMKWAQGREVLLIGVSLVIGGLGYLGYVGTGVLGIAVAGDIVLGAGFAWYLSLSQALIQRVAPEHTRGRVTGVVGMLQETAALGCSVGISALGGLVLLQPFLVGSAILLALAGAWGIRAGALHRRLARSPFVEEARAR